ncbi:MAG TPA: holo-ACP synthase [Thermodesulfovibrionales bacterium]|nr:holo-ACP synthase [Thermodesulfovibrionales bacterium]
MIFGVGIDMVRTERLRKAVEKWGERFLRRVFTEDEIAHCFTKRDPYPSLSVRFAAKEAFVKAIGSRESSPWTDIEVSQDSRGKPLIRGSGRFEIFLRGHSVRHAHLSLSHEKEYGIACVVLETERKGEP